MNLRKLTTSSLLLAIGMVIHQITPPFIFGMKPDLLLTLMIVAIIITDDYKNAVVIGIVSGILTAMTTGLPGGQVPNLIDKIITAQVVFGINRLLKNSNEKFKTSFITLVGTVLSGSIFLGTAIVLMGAKISFTTLFLTIVLPTAGFNFIASFPLLGIIKTTFRVLKY